MELLLLRARRKTNLATAPVFPLLLVVSRPADSRARESCRLGLVCVVSIVCAW